MPEHGSAEEESESDQEDAGNLPGIIGERSGDVGQLSDKAQKKPESWFRRLFSSKKKDPNEHSPAAMRSQDWNLPHPTEEELAPTDLQEVGMGEFHDAEEETTLDGYTSEHAVQNEGTEAAEATQEYEHEENAQGSEDEEAAEES